MQTGPSEGVKSAVGFPNVQDSQDPQEEPGTAMAIDRCIHIQGPVNTSPTFTNILLQILIWQTVRKQ